MELESCNSYFECVINALSSGTILICKVAKSPIVPTERKINRMPLFYQPDVPTEQNHSAIIKACSIGTIRW
jgi:hypothetical protein